MHVRNGAVLTDRDIADQRQQLALLFNRNAAVLPGRAIEPADAGMLERTDRSDLSGRQLLCAGELLQRRDRLVTRVTHHHIGDDIRVLDDLALHDRLRLLFIATFANEPQP
jgi:hypothetical protein